MNFDDTTVILLIVVILLLSKGNLCSIFERFRQGMHDCLQQCFAAGGSYDVCRNKCG